LIADFGMEKTVLNVGGGLGIDSRRERRQNLDPLFYAAIDW
jgi:diaminopimelate decarboxylase